jgi:DNA mismatch repair ATPase MutS
MMHAFLMEKERNFDLHQPLPSQAQEVIQDLELQTLFNTMAHGDPLLLDVAQKAFLLSRDDLDTIDYRQRVLQDCLNNAATVRSIYALAVEAIEREKHYYWGFFRDYPDAILHRSVDVMQMFLGVLKKLTSIVHESADCFVSEGFSTLFAMLRTELDDAYFATVQEHLKTLTFRGGVLISAILGMGNKGENYVLRKPLNHAQPWIERIFAEKPPSYTFFISERDESGTRALSELQARGINLVANALAQSAEHVLSFFTMLRVELAFYIGCLNLYEHLTAMGAPVSFPLPGAADACEHEVRGLYDVCLALTMKQCVVDNDVDGATKYLVIITGANQGGKSTFLRSIGLAQLMMQCGMFVPATSFCANVCTGLFTHFRRKEDISMKSGKLDEELSRMSIIVDTLKPHALLLLNESFAATNEREGSEIAKQIIRALVEKHVKVFFVTHLYEFAHDCYDKHLEDALFLRAERQTDGKRTFKIVEGEPLHTSYGEDLYQRIFHSLTNDNRSGYTL